jgi:hypothetical protein
MKIPAASARMFAAPFFISVALAGSSLADTRVKIESHTDEYYYMGRTHPAVDQTSEIWFCGGKLVYITENEKIVFDAIDSSLVYMNLSDSTYAATELPLDWAGLVSGETLEFLNRYKRFGEVRQTPETKTINGWLCRAYDIESWLIVEDGRYSEREERVWMSKDLPLDWPLFDGTHRDLLVLLNYHDDFISKLLEIEGFSVAVETKTYMQGFSVSSYQRVVEVRETAPPPGLCGIPDGFTKKPELSLEDLNG